MKICTCDICKKEYPETELTHKDLAYTLCSSYWQTKNFDICRNCERKIYDVQNKAFMEFLQQLETKAVSHDSD